LVGQEQTSSAVAPSTEIQQINSSNSLANIGGGGGTAADALQTSGAIWITSYTILNPAYNDALIKLAMDGSENFYPIPSNYVPGGVMSGAVANLPSTYQGITLGPAGTPWITLMPPSGSGATALGRVNADGSITVFPISSTNVGLAGITTGSDGALWFTEANTNQIGRMTTSGTVKQYTVPTPQAGLGRIIAGPNNTIWFTEMTAGKIGKLTY
jgi:hypothetical protein